MDRFNPDFKYYLFSVQEGDRIAQLIIERIYTPEVQEVDVSSIYLVTTAPAEWQQDLEETVRGAGGFGSTGGHVLLNANPAWMYIIWLV